MTAHHTVFSDVGLLLRNSTAIVLVCGCLLLCFAAAAQTPGADRARALEGRIIDRFTGKGVEAVTVRLFDAGGVLMDLSQTDSSGKYSLDLGVLDPSEYSALGTFYIEARDDSDHSIRASLSEGTTREESVIRYRVLSLP